ncbi:phosphoribosyltransferase [Thiocapsa sp.]|uniref:phosphoribosyltransferase n=1 Tax=Thiocapsa sp. TaxID=2024551 RepID=UPI002CFE623C|nr:phosphoribosyltransferase [Thiocapsa sp.]HSO84653.1 phosphoribosyltransferase [Thiocapsa sp.]
MEDAEPIATPAEPKKGLRRAIERKQQRCAQTANCVDRIDAILSDMPTRLDSPIQTLPLRATRPSSFPDADIHAAESRVKKHDLYAAAKGGDATASVGLVLDLLDEASIESLRRYESRSPMIVPVHGLEGVSANAIPAVLAVCLSDRLGFDLSTEIIRTSKAAHTGSSGWWRLKSPALFGGEVTAGRSYILVDDFIGMGGTFANLRGYIEARGGAVVHAQALTGKPYSAKLALQASTLQALRSKHGDIETWWVAQFGYGFDELTESEALYLLRIEHADAIRRRLAQAESQGDG